MQKQHTHSLKKVLVLLMLGVYVFGLVKPTLPLVKDALAHTFFNSAHMATVHLENGRYHLHLELNEEAKKSDSKQSAVISHEMLAAHIKTNEVLFIPFLYPTMEVNSPYINVSTDVYISTPLLPPRC